jgi:hypothetical protein
MTTYRTTSGTTTPGVGGKLVGTIFFLFFLGMGLLFVGLVAREAIAGLRTWTWRRTECDIIQSSVRETNQRGRSTGDFSLALQYRYRFGDREFSSDSPTVKPRSFSDYGQAARLSQAYPEGARRICYVNPNEPSQAVVQRGSLAFPLLVLFPMIFVAIGVIGIYSVWRSGTGALSVVNRPISDRSSTKISTRTALLFFGVFAGFGTLLCFVFLVRPLTQIALARNWPAIQCRILSSEVRSHSGNHGSTYSVNILYSYRFNDRDYKANRYDFFAGSSSGYDGKRAIVARFMPGSTAICYVDPADPTEAVLNRGFTPIMWIGLLPLVFALIGVAGLVTTVRKRRQERENQIDGRADAFGLSPSAVPELGASGAPTNLKLQPGTSAGTKFVAAIAIALFWNGIISVFLFHLIKQWRTGPFEWFLALFLTPFVLIGLILLGVIGYLFLGLFNPRTQLKATPGTPRLGDSLRVEWEVSGRVEALDNFRVILEGREESTYSRGTKTATDRSVFASVEVAATTVAQEMRSGTATVTIPNNMMHSFSSRHNKIIWSLRLEGEIPRWPDLKEEYVLGVLPLKGEPKKDL